MSFAQDNGYTPQTILQLIDFVRQGINDQFGTSYTTDSFVGTNWYKYFYTLIQKIQENETKTSEIFAKLQTYISLTNEKIQRPSVSFPGLVDSFTSQGFVVSVKPPADADAGKIFICVDLDSDAPDYGAKKLQVAGLIRDFVAAGLVSQGSEVSAITISNGQSFDFKFNLANEIPVLLKMTAVTSENNLLSIPEDTVIRQKIFDDISAAYRLGLNFEPQRYFNLSDALWAATVVLEWSDDAGSNWHSTVYDAAYTDIYTFGLEDIAVVIS